MSDEIKKQFLDNVANHSMAILHDDGLYRHLKFSNEGSYHDQFNLVTWPGCLCITGDCETFVFSRALDMFEFFERDELSINQEYWSEKCRCPQQPGVKEYSPEKFRERVLQRFDDWRESEEPDEKTANEVRQAIEDDVLDFAENGEQIAYAVAYDFACKGFALEDFLDGGGTEDFTPFFTWCCYAIVWGIQQYNRKATQ